MSTLRISLLSALILTLTACGFSPMYGSLSSGGTTTQGLDKVEIAMIPNQEGIFLRNVLIDQFYQSGYPTAPTYRLEVEEVREQENDLDITLQSEATRKQIKFMTKVRLRDIETGKVVVDRDMVSLTSYNVLGTQFTTRVSENDAREAALNDLARQIESQVALYLNRE